MKGTKRDHGIGGSRDRGIKGIKGITGSRDQGIKGSRDRGIEGSKGSKGSRDRGIGRYECKNINNE